MTALDAWFDLLRTLDVDVARFMVRSGTHSVCDVASAGGARALVPRVLPSGKGSGARGLDGYLLYEDRLVDVLEQSSPAVNEGRLSVARAGLQTLLNRIGWRRPVQPYYAFILADGDHMGKAIDSLTTVADHRRLSERLDAWAGTCRADIEGYLGTCIYAGGDDVLALVPLHTALECAAHLAESFHAMIENAAKELTPGGRPEQLPTLSVGMAIVHHMVPMKDALDLVRRAEKDAKVTRNALAIRVAKRSGGEIVARAAWDSPDGPLHLRIPEWCRVFSDEQLPDKAAFAMEEAVSLLIDDPTSREPHASSDVVEALARRALGRRRGGRGGDALGDELSKKLHLRFKKQADPGAAVRALSAELQIARLFLDAYDEAWGDLGPSASAVHAEEVR